MTLAEHRAKCIEAIAACIYGKKWNELVEKDHWLNYAAEILDSLPTAGVRVNPIEATEEMIEASYAKERQIVGALAYGLNHSLIFETMSAVGDLTKPPETEL